MHRRKIGFAEGQKQGVFANVQQVPVRSHQQCGNFRQRSFRQNQAVVKIVLGKKALPEQPANKLLTSGFPCRVQVEHYECPSLYQAGTNACSRQRTLRFAVPMSENDVQFVNRRGRQNQCVTLALENLTKIVGDVFVFGEIEDDISVE